jgi:LCP family protein required for cell wall assembly
MNGHAAPFLPKWPYSHGRWPFAVLDVLLASLVCLCILTDMRLNRIDAVSPYPLKPTWGLGQDWLLLIRDERRPPDAQRQQNLQATRAQASPVDTIMLLHLPRSGGRPTLVSLPLNSFVVIAGYGPGSLSTAFARGGPALLVRTLEAATHISIERYGEIDLSGLAAMVDAVGGVRVCAGEPPQAANATPGSSGCSSLSGTRAVDYLRARTSVHGELDRTRRQLRLITALIEKATGPGVALNPVRIISLARRAVHALTVDEGDHLYDLIRLALAFRRNGGVVTVTVPPMRRVLLPGVGPVVMWDPESMGELASAFVTDHPVPKRLITD